MSAISTALLFGAIEIHPAQRKLLVGGQPASIGARAFDLLLTLAQTQGRTVSKSELLERVWPGLIVEENNLQVQISALRKILGAGAISTVPGRGYTFTLLRSDEAKPAGDNTSASAIVAMAGEARPPQALARAPLIGRDEDLQSLCRLVREHPVVTVVGAGGIGKTRLAQAAATALQAEFSDGTWWVELAALTDPQLVASAAAAAVGVQRTDARSEFDALAAQLATQSALLVLDNCEHVLDAVAQLADGLSARAPRLRVLVTSQEPLKTTNEQLLRLDPLALADAGATLAGRALPGAVELFLTRARALDPRFDDSPSRLAVAADICRRLDGIPLAIEMAAARLPLLGLEGLRQRLDERFRVLTAGARVALRRHQTLRATLDWSHGLLGADEQVVLRRLGVFAGTFALESAQDVAGDQRLDPWSVLEHLGALVDKSLVVAEGDPVPRYRLLETTRAYAVERLGDAAETASVLRRHAESLRDRLAIFEIGHSRAGMKERAVVGADLDNLRAALGWAQDAKDDIALEIAGLSLPIWIHNSLPLEGIERCLVLRERLGRDTPPLVAARFWRTIARLGTVTGRLDCFEAAGRAAALYRQLHDDENLYECLLSRAAIGAERGDVEAAAAAIEEGARLEGLHISPRLRGGMAWARQRWLRHLDRLDEALDAVLQQAALYREEGFEAMEAIAHGANVAACENALGRYSSAEARARRALERIETLGAARDGGHVRASLMNSLILQGRCDEAIEQARAALPLLRAEGDEFRLLEPLALNAALAGRYEDAARITGYVDAHRAHNGAAREPELQRRRDRIDALLGGAPESATLSARQAQGAALDAAAIFAHAFGDRA